MEAHVSGENLRGGGEEAQGFGRGVPLYEQVAEDLEEKFGLTSSKGL